MLYLRLTPVFKANSFHELKGLPKMEKDAWVSFEKNDGIAKTLIGTCKVKSDVHTYALEYVLAVFTAFFALLCYLCSMCIKLNDF